MNSGEWKLIHTRKDVPEQLHSRSFLVWCPQNKCIYCVTQEDGTYPIFGGSFTDCALDPTHWMPLPEPPQT